ncbi:MAG: glycosyltransferase [Alphaproteobacteria bacterium]|nr:MAG: glycosyltransferase [Alphaproteobacteria bacterium]
MTRFLKGENMLLRHSKNQIWQVVDSCAYGGIESHILYLATALKEEKHNVYVVFLNDYGVHPLEARLKEKAIPYVKCHGILSYLNLIKVFNPMLIHSHGYKANLASRVAGKVFNIPTVSSFHAGDCETMRLKFYTTLDRKTAFLTQPVAVNEYIANSVSGTPQVIDNFVPMPPYYKDVQNIQNIGFVGRLSHEKGADRFVDLASRFPTMDFHVFGDGVMKAELQANATDNVKFHGHTETMVSAWKTMDILCMPSRKEGLPMAALEAMSHGIPVLAYGAGALPKLITDGENGWLLDLPEGAQTHTFDMESALRTLTIPHVRNCGIKARETIKTAYSQHVLIAKFIKLYEGITRYKKDADKALYYV